MSTPLLRTWSYRVALLLAAVYAVYVVVLKLLQRPTGGPLGEVGEFLLVLVAVSVFSLGLFLDESLRKPESDAPHDAAG